MRIRIAVLIVSFAVLGCTKHNPAVCCNTPTQCSSFGLDGVIGCDTGKVCDADGTCISPQCASSAECGDTTPYCSSEGLCEMTCVADTECPGAGEAASQIHCVGGACVECGSGADCPASAPICASSACRICQQNDECATEVCGIDGTCIAADSIAYVTPAGSDAADCSQATPCSLTHGVSLGRTYTLLTAGTYQITQGLTLTGTRWLLGSGASPPTVMRSTGGPILTVGVASDLHVSYVVLSGATNTTTGSNDGTAILCPNDGNPRLLELSDVTVTGSAYNGVDANTCSVTATHSAFTRNGAVAASDGSGLYVKDNNATIDACDFTRNGYDGFNFDGSVALVVNSFFTSNGHNGATISSEYPGGHIQFSTSAENVKMGLSVGIPVGVSFDLTNNLVGGNGMSDSLCSGGTCPTGGSIMLGADDSTAHFKTHTDFHITAGSVAIDAAAGSTLDHDFDGDVRPLGAGRDVGADEAQ